MFTIGAWNLKGLHSYKDTTMKKAPLSFNDRDLCVQAFRSHCNAIAQALGLKGTPVLTRSYWSSNGIDGSFNMAITTARGNTISFFTEKPYGGEDRGRNYIEVAFLAENEADCAAIGHNFTEIGRWYWHTGGLDMRSEGIREGREVMLRLSNSIRNASKT